MEGSSCCTLKAFVMPSSLTLLYKPSVARHPDSVFESQCRPKRYIPRDVIDMENIIQNLCAQTFAKSIN